MKNLILLLCIIGTIQVSCDQEPADLSAPGKTTKVHYQPDSNDFGFAPDTVGMGGNKGDTYVIDGIHFEADQLIVTVAYSGGCASHEFEIQGQLSPVYSDPPKGSIAIIHTSNNDACEAWITEEIRIDLKELLGTTRADLSIFNPSQNETRYSLAAYSFLPQGNACALEVTFEEAICGTGIYDNRWFKLKDDGTWLQPVSLKFSVDDTLLELGKTYKVGFWNTHWPGDSSVVTCMAYPGPSVMAEISCIEAL